MKPSVLKVVNVIPEESATNFFLSCIYTALMNYVMPFAEEESNLEDHEIEDYLHDFYLDLQENRVRKVDGITEGRYDLELLADYSKRNVLSKFFFQYVQRARMSEGRWVDRRLWGRRTQAELRYGLQAPYHIPPLQSYEMHLKGDSEDFISTLSQDELSVLKARAHGESCHYTVKSGALTFSRYKKALETLKNKAEKRFGNSALRLKSTEISAT